VGICICIVQYGLEGGESMIPALDTLFSSAAQGKSLDSQPYLDCVILMEFTSRWNPTYHPR